MNTNTIMQFECFETNLVPEEFIPAWEYYARSLLNNHVEVTLHEKTGGSNKFKYISKHEWPEDNFQFSFMKGRISSFFSDGGVKIVQAGGYIPIQEEYIHDEVNAYRKLVLFLSGAGHIQQYKDLLFHRYLNIYQSYFESCVYDSILEFFIDEQQTPSFLQWLQMNRPAVETGLYKECLVLHE